MVRSWTRAVAVGIQRKILRYNCRGKVHLPLPSAAPSPLPPPPQTPPPPRVHTHTKKKEGECAASHHLLNKYISAWRRGLCHWGQLTNVQISQQIILNSQTFSPPLAFSFCYTFRPFLMILSMYIKSLLV